MLEGAYELHKHKLPFDPFPAAALYLVAVKELKLSYHNG